MTAQHPPGRARRPLSRVDPRLVIGVILVAASVAGVLAIVSALDRSVTVYTARDTLIAGDVVTARELLQTEVRLGTLLESYLTPESLPAEGVVIARTVDKGDEVVSEKDATVIVDAKAVLFLLGTELDFKTDRFSSTFVFNNPNQVSACGCGESVEIKPRSESALAAS